MFESAEVLIPSSSGLKAGLDYDVETGEFFKVLIPSSSGLKAGLRGGYTGLLQQVLIPSSSGLKAGLRSRMDGRDRRLNPFFIRSQGRTSWKVRLSGFAPS